LPDFYNLCQFLHNCTAIDLNQGQHSESCRNLRRHNWEAVCPN
jgi:hypothetical protein